MTVSGRVEDLRDVGVQVLDDGDPLPTARENGDGLVAGVDVCRRKESGEWAGYLWSPGWVEMWRIDVATVATVAQSGAVTLTGVQDADVDAEAADVVAQVAQSGTVTLTGVQSVDVLADPAVTAAVTQSGALSLSGVQSAAVTAEPGVEASVAQSGTVTLTGVQDADVDAGTGTSWADAVAATSPSVWLRLDESSGTTAADSSGNGTDGTYSGVTLGETGLVPSDPSNDAVTVDAGTEFVFVDLGSALSHVDGATWAFVYEGDGSGNAGARIMARSESTAAGDTWWGPRVDGTNVVVWVDGSRDMGVASSTLTDGDPHLVAVVVVPGSPVEVKLYIDGTEAGSATAAINDSGDPGWWLGRNGQFAQACFGTYDEWMMWHRDLSSTEVSDLHDAWTA